MAPSTYWNFFWSTDMPGRLERIAVKGPRIAGTEITLSSRTAGEAVRRPVRRSVDDRAGDDPLPRRAVQGVLVHLLPPRAILTKALMAS